jgi:hypothetical protein
MTCPIPNPDRVLAPYLQRLERAGGRLAASLNEIDGIVRIVKSKPDWLSVAVDELTVVERSLLMTVERIREARFLLRLDAQLTPRLPHVRMPHVDEWQDWPIHQSNLQE